jgi:glutaredoxin
VIFKIIRWPLGQLILLVDLLTRPRRPQREPALQAAVDEAVRGYALYQFRTCPFCVKTRRAVRRLGLDIELRDAQHDPHARGELLEMGGKVQVPCLRMPGSDGDSWLYESDDIIAHLQERVRTAEAV